MISVVIPSYRRRDGMLALLADVYRQEGVDFEVIVVDDRSPDDSVEAIRREFPQVKLIVNEVNSGPSVTRNRGVREAKGEIVVGFDSDVTLPDAHLLAKVEASFQDPSVTGVAMRIFKPDGKSEDVGRWWHSQPIGTHAHQRFETSYFSGTAYAFRREEMLAAGLFPEILYMHYEEVELAWRIMDAGGRIVHEPEQIVIHHANPVSRRGEVEVFLKPRNQILIAASCLPIPQAAVYALPRTAYQAFKACTHGHFKDFVRAMISAMKLLPRQWSLRKPLRGETLRRIGALKQASS